jgi:hypothetical protein
VAESAPEGRVFRRVYDTLLFLHVLTAFAIVATVVVFSAFALRLTTDSRVLAVGNVLWAIGGLGTLVFGIWLALYAKGYEIWDGWIIAAIILWAIATELGRRSQVGYTAVTGGAEGGVAAPEARQAALMHWLRSIFVLALLVVMIYKPGA